METEKPVMTDEQNIKDVSSVAEKKKVEKKSTTTTVSTTTTADFNSLNLFTPDGIAAAKELLTLMMRSEKGGVKRVEDGIAILLRAKDLGLPFTTSIEHIHVINGKTGVDIHIIKALLLKAGCTYKKVKDYQPLYEYTDGFSCFVENLLPQYAIKCASQTEAESRMESDTTGEHIYVYPVLYYQDFSGNIYKSYQWHKKFKLVVNKKQAQAAQSEGFVPVFRIPNKPVDYETEYEFERRIDGRIMTVISRFSYSDAAQAELLDKDNYKKYPKIMIAHRAFTYGARDIADDVLFGTMSTDELKVVTNNNTIEDADYTEV